MINFIDDKSIDGWTMSNIANTGWLLFSIHSSLLCTFKFKESHSNIASTHFLTGEEGGLGYTCD